MNNQWQKMNIIIHITTLREIVFGDKYICANLTKEIN